MKEQNGDFNTKQGITELWLHYLWKENGFPGAMLTSDDGKELKILSAGWYNRGWGPDFKDGRIQIGDDEFFGDIEIHIEESAWKKHKHDFDEVYNKVILHVFLIRSHEPVFNQLGQKIPSLYIGDLIEISSSKNETDRLKVHIQELPGACGLFLTESKYLKTKKLIFQAAEQRLLSKSDQFQNKIIARSEDALEDVLFTSIFKSVGYSTYAKSFEKIALMYPYSKIKSFFKNLHRQSRIEILARWLGSMNILDSIEAKKVHNDVRREWTAFQQFWQQLENKKIMEPGNKKSPSRPLNSPIRRLTGLFYHLEKLQFEGLVKSWLRFFQSCQHEMDNNKQCLPAIMRLLDQMFPQPEWDPLNHLIVATSKRPHSSKLRLLGKQRQLIILVNSILPFFTAWSRLNQDRDLEKTLFALFLILPAEGHNRKTRFMEQRLLNTHPGFGIKKNLSYHQGLIQLHDDCCRSFYEGCNNCSLVKMMK